MQPSPLSILRTLLLKKKRKEKTGLESSEAKRKGNAQARITKSWSLPWRTEGGRTGNGPSSLHTPVRSLPGGHQSWAQVPAAQCWQCPQPLSGHHSTSQGPGITDALNSHPAPSHCDLYNLYTSPSSLTLGASEVRESKKTGCIWNRKIQKLRLSGTQE